MRKFFLSGLCLAAMLPFAISASAGCRGNGCYEQVVTPPLYSTQHEQVLVAPERRIAHRIPAEYRTVEETVLIRPERQVAHPVPAAFSTVAETVQVSPGGRQWQVSRDANGRTIGCWVDVPPQYATRHREVLVRPASTVYETIPAVTATRARTVLARPANVEIEVIPPQYETVARHVQVAPASVSWAPIGGRGGGCGRGLFSSCGD